MRYDNVYHFFIKLDKSKHVFSKTFIILFVNSCSVNLMFLCVL